MSGTANGDTIEGRDGNDTIDGGTGTDTLRLELTYGEAADAGVQADLAAYDAFLALNSNPNTDSGPTFQFTAYSNLAATDFEGYAIDLINNGPVAVDDGGATDEDTAVDIVVVANDTDVDHLDVLSVDTFDGVSALGAAISLNLDGSLNYDSSAAFALQSLAVGESAVDTFSYQVRDLAGATSTATVTARPRPRSTAAMPPAISIWDMTQPPKMSPLALASAGMATRWRGASTPARTSGRSATRGRSQRMTPRSQTVCGRCGITDRGSSM